MQTYAYCKYFKILFFVKKLFYFTVLYIGKYGNFTVIRLVSLCFFSNRLMDNLLKLWDNLGKLERTESYEQCASDLSRSFGALALHVAQDHNFSDRLFITSGSDFSALVNLTTPPIIWDKAAFPSFVSIKSNTCRAVYKEGWLLSWGFLVHFHFAVKYRTHLCSPFSVPEPSSDALKRTNLIQHFQGVILLFSRERSMCLCVLNSFKAHNILFASVTVSSSKTAWTFEKLAALTVPCALCLRTWTWL